MNREAIYNALLAFLEGLNLGVKSSSRVWRPHTDYAVAQLPALCIDEDTEPVENPGFNLPSVESLNVDVWLYFVAPQLSQTPGRETVLPQTPLNNALDKISNGLKATPLGYQTLGGLVQWIRIEGQIKKAVGVASGNTQFCIAKVPITMCYAGPA